MNLLVVGAGAMGRWFADAVAESVDSVAFADPDETATRAAVREASPDARTVALDGDDRFDAVCIAVPIPAATEAIAAHAGRAERAVLDVTGSATDPVAAMREHAPDRERLSLHPLFAPENAPGNVAVVADERGPVSETIVDALTDRGNHCFETTADEHDTAMETVQARAHVAVLAFALAAEDVPDGFQTPISEGLFALVDQVTDGESRVYADIQETFEGADDLAAAAQELAAADPETFADLYREAGGNR